MTSSMKNILTSLETSNSSNERKKCMDQLREMVNDRRFIQLLNHNSKQRVNHDDLNWDTVFSSVHRLLLREAERIRTDGQKASQSAAVRARRENLKNDYSTMVVIVVSKANQDMPRIKCLTLVRCVLEVLNNDFLKENFADKYINIFRSKVMTFRKYWGEITSEYWAEILRTFLALLKTPPTHAELSSIVEVLNCIVLHGSSHSFLGLKLRKTFSSFAEPFSDSEFYNKNILYQEALLQLSTTLCLQLAKECRKAACQFGEHILVPVIRLYNKVSKKNLLFEFLLLQVHLHHPEGVAEGEGAAYACDWTCWRHQLWSLYSIVELDINRVQRIKFGVRETVFSPTFLQFAIQVCKQVFKNSSNVLDVTMLLTAPESTAGPPVKRRRMVAGVQTILDCLRTLNDPQDMWPWLSLLGAYMYKYPCSVKELDFLSALQLMAELQSTCKDALIMDYLCQCCISLLKVENGLVTNTLDDQTVNPLWEKIWETTLRTVGLNQNEKESHRLLQALIMYNKMFRAMELVNMFISGTIKLSTHSLWTLDTLCGCCTLPDTVNHGKQPVKSALLAWLLPWKDHLDHSEQSCMLVPPALTSSVLVKLILKSQLTTAKKSLVPIFDESCGADSMLNTVDKDYMVNSFECGLLMEVQGETLSPLQEQGMLVDATMRDKVLELLLPNCVALETWAEKNSQVRLPFECATHCGLLLGIWPCIMNTELSSRFVETWQYLLSFMLPYLRGELHGKTSTLDIFGVHRLFQELRQLYQTSHHSETAYLLQEATPNQLLEAIFVVATTRPAPETDLGDDLMDLDMGPYASECRNLSLCSAVGNTNSTTNGFVPLLSTDLLTEKQKLQLEAVEFLCSYCCNSGGLKSNKAQVWWRKLLEFCLSDNCNSVCDFHMAVLVVRSAGGASVLDEKHLALVLRVLQAMCRCWHQDSEAVGVILSLLQGVLVHVHNVSGIPDKENTIALVRGILKCVKNEKYGPKVCSSFVKCLIEFAKVDPTASWAVWDCGSVLTSFASQVTTPIAEEVLQYLRSPFHEIRMAAAGSIGTLFSSAGIVFVPEKLKCQMNMFEKLCQFVMYSFIVEGELTEQEVVDESANRTASALHALATLVVVSPLLRKRGLFVMLQVAKEKNLNIELVHKVLALVGDRLGLHSMDMFMATNLNYLLTHWLQQEYTLEEFPWCLLNNKSVSAFYTENQNVIIPILLQREDENTLKEVCKLTGLTTSQFVEACYPRVIACLLPCFSVDTADPSLGITDLEVRIAKRLHYKMEALLSKERIEELMATHLSSVVVELMRLMHDPEHLTELCGYLLTLPDPDPPFFRHCVILRSHEYLQHNSASPETPLVVFLSQRQPSHIQKILLHLGMDIYCAPTLEDKLKSFHHYIAFAYILALELDSGSLKNVAPFAIRDIFYVLVRLIRQCYKNNEMPLAHAATCFLRHFCGKCLPACAYILEKFLFILVSTLVPLAKLDNEMGSQALNLLKFVIVDNADCLSSAIRLLDPFPGDAVFKEVCTVYTQIKYSDMQYTLEEEIRHFLNAGSANLGCRTEGLQHLRTQLSEKKMELRLMYKDLESIRGFSEECATSVLHRLVCVLVQLASSPDPKISLEAARCLGELGPADLTTTVLCPESLSKLPDGNMGSDEVLQVLTNCILGLLVEYLVDEDIQVVQAASRTLYTVLASKEGQYAVESNQFETSHSLGILGREYLTPFLSIKKCKKSSKVEIDEESFKHNIDRPNLWCPMSECSHATWITNLVCAILETFPGSLCFLPQLVPVCKVKVPFSESLLPLVLQLVLCVGSENSCAIVCRHMRHFFGQHFTAHVQLNPERSSSPAVSLKHCNKQVFLNKTAVQCMLDMAHLIHLRNSAQKLVSRKGVSKEHLLELDFLHVAQAAQFCSAYFTSILYAELWCDKQFRRRDNTIDDFSQINSPLEYVCDTDPVNSIIVQNILWEAYLRLGDCDAVYGCGSSHMLDPHTRTRHYELLGEWDKAMLIYDTELASGNVDATRGLLGAMQRFGLHHVMEGYISSAAHVGGSTGSSQYFQFECAWRLAHWNVPVTMTKATTNRDINTIERKKFVEETEYEKYRFLCLKAMHEADLTTLEEAVACARNCIIESLAHASLESCKNVYKALSQLQAIQEIEDFACIWRPNSCISLENVMKKWKYQDNINFNEFEYVEPILWQRTIMLDLAMEKGEESRQHTANALATLRLEMASLARRERHHHVAARSLGMLTQTLQHTPNIAGRLKLEEAQLAWARGDQEVGRHLLRSLLTDFSSVVMDKPEVSLLYSSALKLYGDWMVETKSENSQFIINEYFFRALNVMDKVTERNEVLLDIYSSLARFADAEYQQLVSYFKSNVFEIKKKWIAKMLQDAAKLKMQSNITREDMRAISMNEKQSDIDMSEIHNKEEEKDMYLTNAMTYYLKGLEHGDKNNLQVFRVASLWLENTTHKQLNQILEHNLSRIPSYKFLLLLPQLTPRISNIKDDFTVKLNTLLKRCAIDHPHHTLPLILALSNMYKDREHVPATSSMLEKKPLEPRVFGAQLMIQLLQKIPEISSLINRMDQVSSALIDLAYLQIGGSKCSSHSIPKDHLLLKLKNLDSVLVPTLSIAVKKNSQYNIIGIREFQPSFSFVGGLNAPKKLHCVGTDGITRPQLVKGQDDLRQDAVMQQVFTMMNMFLHNNKDTSKRKLLIRTYKVVPLSQRSGIIEWCENTEPIGVYLTGSDHKSGAHRRYRPQDLTSVKCRQKMNSVASKSNEEKLQVYKELCKSIQPVLRNFFLENFPIPGMWFERRLAYTHSVATSSMIGYILGLGDRHLINILIDKKTAEVIHIDFGIAFEMGHILPTPETVPFRLTRDIVDGMGVSGIEGVFRRCCEKTLAVLRQNQETILTILEVLLYDPLYAWTITPTKAYNLQRNEGAEKIIFHDEGSPESSVQVNKMAERALVRLQQKLQGTEKGAATSVVGQVSHLLQQATDAGNLSRLYSGWSPYL